jgi:hypothetical protein
LDFGGASYEPNWEIAYNLTLRAGTLVKVINARHGKRLGEVFKEIMVAGVAVSLSNALSAGC